VQEQRGTAEDRLNPGTQVKMESVQFHQNAHGLGNQNVENQLIICRMYDNMTIALSTSKGRYQSAMDNTDLHWYVSLTSITTTKLHVFIKMISPKCPE